MKQANKRFKEINLNLEKMLIQAELDLNQAKKDLDIVKENSITLDKHINLNIDIQLELNELIYIKQSLNTKEYLDKLNDFKNKITDSVKQDILLSKVYNIINT